MATDNHVLDQADQRGTAAASAEAGRRAAILEERLLAPLRPDYERAMAGWPEAERQIHEVYYPYPARVQAIATKAKVPIPQPMRVILDRMVYLCEAILRQVPEGIAAFRRVTFEDIKWKDESVDVNLLPAMLAGIGGHLRSIHQVSDLRQFKLQVEFYIEESGWPKRGAGSTLTTGAPRPAEMEIRVESEFRV